MNVIVVHDVEAPFGLVILVHVFEDDQGFEGLELLVLLELPLNGIILVEV